MKKLLLPQKLSWMMLICGCLGLTLHRVLYLAAVDGKGLLTVGHPLELLLWGLTIGVVALALAATVEKPKQKKEKRPAQPSGGAVAAAGDLAMALCLVVTVLLQAPEMSGAIGVIWRCLGLAAGGLLAWAGICSIQGKKRPFWGRVVTCLFLSIHIVTHYQTWSGDPQLQDYVFTMLGLVALTFTAFYQSVADVGLDRQWAQPLAELLTIYFCLISAMDTRFQAVQLGGMIWAWTCLWGRPEESKGGEGA